MNGTANESKTSVEKWKEREMMEKQQKHAKQCKHNEPLLMWGHIFKSTHILPHTSARVQPFFLRFL